MATLTRRVLTGTGWSALSTVARQLLSFASLAVLARLLGPSAYGLMGMAALTVSVLVNFRDLGTATAIIQRKTVSERLLCSLFWVNIGFGFLLFVSVAAIARPAGAFFHQPELAPILRTLAISFWITSAGAVHSAILAREMAFDKVAWVDIGSALAGYLVALPCALGGLGVWSLVYANLANSVAAAALNWFYCKWRPAWQFDLAEMKSVSSFSLNLSGFGLVNYFCRNADNLVIGRFLGNAPLGYYQMAYNLMLYPIQNISSVIGQVFLPAFATIQDDNARSREAYTKACLLIGLITFPVMAGLGVVADPLVRGILGTRWIPMIDVFYVLAPIGALQSIQTTVGHLYVSKGRTDWMFRWGVVSLVVLVLAFLAGVRYGIVGVAIAYAVAYCCVLAYPGFAIPFRLIGLRFRDFARQFLPQLGITSIMAAVCMAWLWGLKALSVTNALAQLTTTVILGAGVYIVMVLALRPPVLAYLEEVMGHSSSPAVRAAFLRLRIFDRPAAPTAPLG